MASTKLALPGNILREIGVSTPSESSRDTNNRWKSQGQNRKDKRKAERAQKKGKKTGGGRPPQPQPQRTRKQKDYDDDSDDFGGFEDLEEPEDTASEPPPKRTATTKSKDDSNLHKRKRGDDGEIDNDDESHKAKKPSRVARDRLAQEDAEIVALERKLGIKGRKKLPKAFHNDGLGDLLDEDGDDSDSKDKRSRAKREADEWLAKKRRKATIQQEDDSAEDEDLNDGLDDLGEDYDEDSEDDAEDGLLEIGNESDPALGEEDDEDDEDSFGGLDDSEAEDAAPPKPKVRENPYVAPVSATSDIPKYIPPSLRSKLGKDAGLEAQIRRRTQGPVNRVTEANLISIAGEIEKIYREHPRGVVTDILTELLMAQVCEPTSKPDTLLVLSAGFVAALYKVIGVDFAAHFIQTVVERFQKEHESAKTSVREERPATKETSNLITALSAMYMLRVVGSNLIFDYVRLLLDDLTELNAELLLRIVKLAGSQLRKDDPLALKDIVSLIRPAVAKIGDSNLSVRTKFMIETINDLKNNKIKAGSRDLAVLNEHVTRMKKLLGSMDTSRVKATEPLRIGLEDIMNAEKSGKWWLVGASWGGKLEKGVTTKTADQQTQDAAKEQQGSDDDTVDNSMILDNELDMPNYAELAREQGMNTDVRRAIFIALVAAADFHDAYLRILKLRLNKYNRREIPNVLVQCSGAQQHYNPYYTLVAGKFCADGRIKYAFQDTLWTLFRRLGEPLFGEEPEDDDEEAADDRRLINTAKMFGNLVVESSVGLGVLKPLNLAYLKETTALFVEVMLITVLQECAKISKQKSSGSGLDQVFVKVFRTGLAPDLARSIRYFMRKKVRTTDLVDGKREAKTVKEACKLAEGMLHQLDMGAEEE